MPIISLRLPGSWRPITDAKSKKLIRIAQKSFKTSWSQISSAWKWSWLITGYLTWSSSAVTTLNSTTRKCWWRDISSHSFGPSSPSRSFKISIRRTTCTARIKQSSGQPKWSAKSWMKSYKMSSKSKSQWWCHPCRRYQEWSAVRNGALRNAKTILKMQKNWWSDQIL